MTEWSISQVNHKIWLKAADLSQILQFTSGLSVVLLLPLISIHHGPPCLVHVHSFMEDSLIAPMFPILSSCLRTLWLTCYTFLDNFDSSEYNRRLNRACYQHSHNAIFP